MRLNRITLQSKFPPELSDLGCWDAFATAKLIECNKCSSGDCWQITYKQIEPIYEAVGITKRRHFAFSEVVKRLTKSVEIECRFVEPDEFCIFLNGSRTKIKTSNELKDYIGKLTP